MEKLKLFDYQVQGSEFLHSKPFALLADKQRLGKTVQAIRAADLIQLDEMKTPHRILVVCRAVARDQWMREFERWSTPSLNRIISVYYTPRNGKGVAQEAISGPNGFHNPKQGQVVITSYESVKYVLENLEGKLDLIIVDESHYLKNPLAARTKTLLGELIHRTHRMWFLTGTPTPNHAGELWPLLYVTGRTKLEYESFVTKFCNTFKSNYGLQITGTKVDTATLDELRDVIGDFMLRRTEKEVSIELPSLFTTTVEVKPQTVTLKEAFPELMKLRGTKGADHVEKMIEDELGLYNQIVNGTMSHLLLETLKANAQSLSTLRRYTALQKVQSLCEIIIDELENKAYEKVVIFCVHTAAAKALKTRLETHKFQNCSRGGDSGKTSYKCAMVIGETVDKDREVTSFQNDPDTRVFIGNINAAGTSINLSVAHHIYFLEESWTPGDNAQAVMRCGGPTQRDRTIFVKIAMLAGNSVDHKVHETIFRKEQELEKIYTEQKLDKLFG